MRHYEHFLDKAPLCWTLDEVAFQDPPAGMTPDAHQVDCPDCLKYLRELGYLD